MELRRLRYFVAIAEELSYRKASVRLHTSQSPLSQQIRKLEDEVGTVLFVRGRSGVELTPAGQALLPEARLLLSRAEASAQRARDANDGRVGTLRIGYLTSLTHDRFLQIMSAFRAKRPEVDVALSDLVPEAVLSALRQREIDVGFLRAPFRDDDLQSLEIWRDPFVVALPKDHWLAGRGPVTTRSLRNETFIMVPDVGSMGMNEAIARFCLKAGFSPQRRLQVNQLQAAIWLVHMGFGISIVPASLQGLRRDNVVYQPLRESATIGAYLVWRKDSASPILSCFRECAAPPVRALSPAFPPPPQPAPATLA